MKCIERRGFTYNVYDMGNGKVLKKEKPKFLQYFRHRTYKHSMEYVRRHKAQALLLAALCEDRELIGNPEFLPDGSSYIQDRAEILDAYIASHTFEENKKILDKYIQSIFDTWQNGFCDIVFNFTRNAGVLPGGRVALVDFNEVTFSKADVAELIRIKRWSRALSYKEGLRESKLKEYYLSAMERTMTLENLDRYWRDNDQLLAKTQ